MSERAIAQHIEYKLFEA